MMTVNTNLKLHPDDVLFFHDVRAAMFRVAKDYTLPLRTVTPFTMPQEGMADRLGDCSASGDVRLVLRATVDGVWAPEPRTPADVWRTAAHELAHLRHMNHGDKFWEFHNELMTAIENQTEDHREKLIRRLVKMQASRDSEAKLGNSEAAEAFASMINKMLVENELSPSALDYAQRADDDPVIELPVSLQTYDIKAKRSRVAWQESLARIVAKAHLCTFLIRPGSNQITFVGTKSHAVVAEYVFGTLVPAADVMATKEKYKYGREVFARDGNWRGVNGFREAWLTAFLDRIAERFNEARQAAVAEAPEGTSQALMRLDGALIKARAYVDDKFSRSRGAAPLSRLRITNSEGAARGRAAADAMIIGRKGVTSGTRGLLK